MSLLMLPEQPDVSWARLLENGGEGGTAAYQIDASGLSQRNRMLYRSLIPNSTSPALKVRLRLTSSLVTSNPAFEGVAVRFRGFQLTGTAPARSDTQVWDSDPDSSGTRAWFSEQSGTYTDAVFVEQIPSDLGIDFITCELVVRAASGQVTISNIECRNHFSTPYPLNIIGSQLWTGGLSVETVATGIGSDGDVERYFRYALTETVDIQQGQLVQMFLKGSITGRAYEALSDGSSAQRLAADVGLMIKLRRTATPTIYDFETVHKAPVSVDAKTIFANDSAQFRAAYAYDQIEVLPFVEPSPPTTGYVLGGVDRLGVEDIELLALVADWVTPTQGIV